MSELNLDRTRRLHERLMARWREDPASFGSAWSAANRELQNRRIAFERSRSLRVVPTALALTTIDEESLRQVAETLYRIIEKALDWILGSADRLQRYFPDHERIFRHLTKTPGLATWQGYARYDAVVMPDGRLKVVEINTACPAGFAHSESFSQVTRETVESLNLDLDYSLDRYGTVPSGTLTGELLAIEAGAGVPEGLVVLVYAEVRQVSRPLLQLAEDVRRFATRPESAAVDGPGPKDRRINATYAEIGALARHFAEMQRQVLETLAAKDAANRELAETQRARRQRARLATLGELGQVWRTR